MGFLNKINLISFLCDVPWRSCDVYDIKVPLLP